MGQSGWGLARHPVHVIGHGVAAQTEVSHFMGQIFFWLTRLESSSALSLRSL